MIAQVLPRCLVALATALTLAAPLQAATADSEGQLPLEELRTFADVFNQIRQAYVEEVDDRTLLEYAIRGMLA
ncbi:MAG TPA: peptidase S41, partial [Spongiibacteraceae bacterium]|nr:peptidase S41 [Spongiibacteraceae bacterium]